MLRAFPLIVGSCLALLTATPASAQLLSYDGFGTGYTVGSAAGQAYQGTGYAAGGTWNNNAFAEGGLTHPTLLTTPGVHVVRTTDDMIGAPDLTAGGPFGSAGLVGGNGNIGGGEVSGTLYYSFLGRDADGDGAAWAGFNLFNGDDEQVGVGNAGTPNDYAVFHINNGTEPAIGTPATPINDQTHFFVVRADYVGNGKDTFTVWLDPDPLLSEGAQNPNISTVATSNDEDDNDGFNQLRMRGDNANGAWEFDEIRLGTTWESVTPVVPEPASGVLAVLGLAAMLGLRRRRR
jgi:hypothetical protein